MIGSTFIDKHDNLESLPLVPLRDIVVFPYTMVPFVVGRRASLLAVEQALLANKRIFLATQRDAKVDNPQPDDINVIGTVANIVQSLKLPNGNIKLLVEGVSRGRVIELQEENDMLMALLKVIDRKEELTPEMESEMQKGVSLFEKYVKLSPNLPYETMISTIRVSEPGRLTDTMAAHLQIPVEEKQNLLETFSPKDRLDAIVSMLDKEIDKLRVDRKIHNRVKKQMEKAQKEYYLSEKMKAIQQELGRKDDRVNEVEEFRQKIEEAKMPEEAKDKALQELKRLEVMPPVSAEATVSRNYLEWLLAVPWAKRTRELRDINKAEAILNKDHYGLDKVKERILEFLAVRRLVRNTKGQILCFVGPPGVGKTSLARSISRATGRNFVRLSLGGVRDEAEIRGHRRTYIGAFPGQIIQRMRKAGTKNPVFLLDEVDKMSMDFRGDPSAALLEVLDPEQNDAFLDHYLDTEYDLSQVMFIATANVLHTIPPAFKDRLEIIRIAGYTLDEKVNIAVKFLLPKQLKAHGLDKYKVEFDDDVFKDIVEKYTRESGVRNLERELASVCRKLARRVVGEGCKKDQLLPVTSDKLSDLLGVPRYHRKDNERESEVGLAIGLAWTEVGGEILHTEASMMPGKGQLTLTGKLGDVMQESAQAALSYIRSRTTELGVEENFYRRHDIHVHVPEGAIPKDGPSAGITIATAVASLLTKLPVRKDVAMTGEITLRGKVLPIGGLKEKVLAAHRIGVRTIILPRDNEKDLADIPAEIQKYLEFKLVETMDEVLQIAPEGDLPNLGKLKDGYPKDKGAPEDSLMH
jgi:ATP-dependent Lon protease